MHVFHFTGTSMSGTYFTGSKLEYSLFIAEYEKIGKVYLFEI